MLKLLGRLLFLGLVGAAAFALWKKLTAADNGASPALFTPSVVTPVVTPAERAPEPAPGPGRATTAWLEPDDGACPVSHPVKAKLSSGIFHVPGGQNYERTRADRCYADASTAEADGLRQARR